MDPVGPATKDFILGPLESGKRPRNDNCKRLGDLGKNSPRSECSRLPKKFAGGIHFPTTQDLNFDQMAADLPITPSQETEKTHMACQLSGHPRKLVLESEQNQVKTTSDSSKTEHCYLRNATNQGDTKIINPLARNPLQSLAIEKFGQNTQVNTSGSFGTLRGPDYSVTSQHQINDSITTIGENLDFAQAMTDKKIRRKDIASDTLITSPNQIGNQIPPLKPELELKQQNVTSDATPSFKKLDRDSACHNTQSKLIPSTPSLNAKVTVRNASIQYQTTKLEAINENEVVNHRSTSSTETETLRENSSETIVKGTQKEKPDEVTSLNESGELITKAPVVPYDKKKISDNALMDAEWELCTQWLNKDRSQILQQLKARSEKANSLESALCYELEQLLVNTREILEKELEFSVRLCSIRGQCLLFQEATRLNGIL